jgi:MSHA biogenesis protein MshI
MRWPWNRRASSDSLVVSWSGQTLAFVRARLRSDGLYDVRQFGVQRQGADSNEDFTRRLQGLGLKGYEACAMLRPEQYQLLQVDAPAVPPEELRAAARYQIRDMLEVHVDDITLDVMRVGGPATGAEKAGGHLFVVAATNAVVREVLRLGQTLQWDMSVIDIQETAQRNLQSALAKRDGRADRANAALVLLDERQAVLTISAKEELFYTRRLDLPEGFMAGLWGQGVVAAVPEADGYAPVEEYVPDYNVSGVSYGTDYTSRAAATPSDNGDAAADDRAQRFLVEVQRSLDLWDRSWSSMPLNGVRVHAGERTDELAQWLSRELGQTVLPMDVNALFPGFEGGTPADRALCWPLLGALMRSESRKL